MKKLLTIALLLLLPLFNMAQTPNANEFLKQKKTQIKYLIQQIGALKIYLKYLKTGYNIAQKGLATISDIKNGTLSLDTEYFNSLKQVSAVVKKAPEVNAILLYQQQIIIGLRKIDQHCTQDENFTKEEVNYIHQLRSTILRECIECIDELILITISGETEMKEEERLLRLDKIFLDIQDRYAFTQTFINSTLLLSYQRSLERKEIFGLTNVHDIE